ncbi:hypothetical protein [Bacteroides phage LoVEphage]|nr:hypothetical protein [Bacteroides phage LoVEphage]
MWKTLTVYLLFCITKVRIIFVIQNKMYLYF